MPFIPHTRADVATMLDTIGVPSVETLFDEIPADLRCGPLTGIPEGLPEMEIGRLMTARAARDGRLINFCGAGAYEHHIPAAVWEIATRGEFYSAYTPYQAEASQGTLQLLYEFQTMMAELTGMEVSNASLYDGATALAEALLMAARVQSDRPTQEVWMPQTLHPYYAEVVASCTAAQGLKIRRLPYDPASGRTCPPRSPPAEAPIAVVTAQPNVFGVLEDVDALTDWAHACGALAIGLVNPTALAVLRPPGQWGARGCDIACGEGQPLGAPLSSGGPYFGFLTARKSLVRQMPGRIVGQTVDLDGKRGFALTLQAREQHIRRAKATSNICTNQGLLVTAATIYLALLGARGLARTAEACMANTRALVTALTRVPGVTARFTGAGFHEAVITLPRPVAPLLEALATAGIFGGFDLSRHFPELGQALLVCATETRTESDIRLYADTLSRELAA